MFQHHAWSSDALTECSSEEEKAQAPNPQPWGRPALGGAGTPLPGGAATPLPASWVAPFSILRFFD